MNSGDAVGSRRLRLKGLTVTAALPHPAVAVDKLGHGLVHRAQERGLARGLWVE